MPLDLYRFLPWRPLEEGDAARSLQLKCLSWVEAIRRLEDTLPDRVHSVYTASYDDDLRPRQLSGADYKEIRDLLEYCRPILDRFDSVQASESPIDRFSTASSPAAIDPGDWGLLGTAARIAELKYLQGRCASAKGSVDDVWACASVLHRAGTVCFYARQPDIYLTGVYFRHHSFLLIADLMRCERRISVLLENAIAAALDAPSIDAFSSTFLAPVAFEAVSLLQQCAANRPSDELYRRMLKTLSTALRDELGVAAAAVDELPSLSDTQHEDSDVFAAQRHDSIPLATREAFRAMHVTETAELIGLACQRCVEALGHAARCAKEELEASWRSFLPTALTGDAIVYNENGAFSAIDKLTHGERNVFGRLYAAGVARLLCEQARRNGFFWYWPCAQHAGASAAIAAKAFSTDNGRPPSSLNEVVEFGYLPHVPTSPFSENPMRYDEAADMVLAEGDDDEIRHWGPVIQNPTGLRWRTHVKPPPGGRDSSAMAVP